MDKLTNFTRGINTTTPSPLSGQNCASTSSSSAFLDKVLIIAPSWISVNQDIKWIFLLHTYGFTSLFFFLGFYTLFSILNLRSLISSRPFMSTINIFLCLLGASRAICLFIDPYHLKEIMPKIIGSIMWDIGFPCITSAFCFIQLAFWQSTQLKFGPEKIQKESCLSLIISGHFFFLIVSDVALTSHNCYMAKYMVETVFLIWSILLYLTFLYAGYKVMHLLKTMPSNMLKRENSNAQQKDIMQLAKLAPHSNLATSVAAAALVPTFLGPKIKDLEENECTNVERNSEYNIKDNTLRTLKNQEQDKRGSYNVSSPLREETSTQPVSTVPEVYVRPPTPTPSTANLPIITVSSPSRRSSLASRRGSDASRSSRRNSECSVRFVHDEDISPTSDTKFGTDFSPKHSPNIEGSQSPERMTRRHSENITPTGSTRELRRCSDFSHEKNRGSQFATKLRRNSDFGNRTPRRMLPPVEQRLPKVLDLSPAGSRRNSDIGTFISTKHEVRRNSDISYRRNSELTHIKPLVINRRSSDISIRTLDKSPTHYQSIVPQKIEKIEIQEKSESDSDQPDSNEKASLMNERMKNKAEDAKMRKKHLSWKTDKSKDESEEITAETNLLPETSETESKSTDFTLHSILNHIAYVNKAKSNTPLRIQKSTTVAARRSQIQRQLYVICATAILGIILCITDLARVFESYGLLAESVAYNTEPLTTQCPKPWRWLLYQTLCRTIELIMGYAMTSIAEQLSVSARHKYLNSYPNYSSRLRRGNNLYI